MKAVTLERLEKTYADGTRAVRGVDLAVAPGEFVVLLGPSGCGKTTTLRMIAGLERPTAGRIRLGADDVTALRASQRDVGFVFQFFALYPHFTVRENIAFPLECVGVGRRERARAVEEVARPLGLGALLERRPRELAGGDQQRVALARAMIRRPSVWLMDEPLGTLDADLRLVLCEFLRAQQLEHGVTTVYVTHDQEEALRLADRVVVMSRGEILQAGAPAEVYDEPADLFVARFVGSPGMNLVRGEVRKGVAGPVFRPEPHPPIHEPPPTQGEAALGTGVSEPGCTLSPKNPAPLALPVPSSTRLGPAVLGIRPEDLLLDPAGPIRGRVRVDEYLGSSRCLHVDTQLGRLVLRCAPDSHPEGSVGGSVGARAGAGRELALRFDPSRARLFEPESGRRLA